MIRSTVHIKESTLSEVNEIWIINYIIQEIEKYRIEYEYNDTVSEMHETMKLLENMSKMGCRVISIVPGIVLYSQKTIEGDKRKEVYGMACYHHTQTLKAIEAAQQSLLGELKKLLDLITKDQEFCTHYKRSISLEVAIPHTDYLEATTHYYKSKYTVIDLAKWLCLSTKARTWHSYE